MTEQEFDDFLIEFANKSEELANRLDAIDEIKALEQEQQFNKIDNLRLAMGLPTFEKMSEEQARGFADILSKYQFADTFLTRRQLETIHRTGWGEIKTERELLDKMKNQIGVGREEIKTLTAPENKGYLTSWIKLSRLHPFYNWLIGKRVEATVKAERELHQIEIDLNDMVKKARSSRRKLMGIKENIKNVLVPTDDIVFGYMEAENKPRYEKNKGMTEDEIKLGQYLINMYHGAYEYMKSEYGLRGRKNYMTHIRRSFLEALKDSGIKSAIQEVFTSQREEEAVFKILDEDTGEVIAFEKFFKFSMRRSGALVPSKNIARSSLAYFTAFTKKKALDEFIPEALIAVQAHKSVTGSTPKGLAKDPSVEKFVNRFLNDAKGRRVWFGTAQGSKSDIAVRAMTMWISIKYLGLNVATAVANFVGDFVVTFWELSLKETGVGLVRSLQFAKAQEINEQFRFFTGRHPIVELFDPQYTLPQRFLKSIMVLMSLASFQSQKFFLRAKMTKEEWERGVLNDDRLKEIALSVSRAKPNKFYIKSLAGNTSVGRASVQFGTWAVTVFNTVASDAREVSKMLIKEKKGWDTLKTKEAQKLGKFAIMAGLALMVASMIDIDDDDDSYFAKIIRKAQRELTTLTQALQFVTDPRNYFLIIDEIGKISEMVAQLFSGEEYKSNGIGYEIGDKKWINSFKRVVTPSTLRSLFPQERGNKKESMVEEAIKSGEFNPNEIVDEVFASQLEDRSGQDLKDYRKKKVGEIKALYNLRKNYPDNQVAQIILDENSNDDRIEKMVELGKEIGIDEVYDQVKKLYGDRNLCSNTTKKTGCLVSGQLFKQFLLARRKFKK